MFQKLKKKLKDQRGLTLIELLAVIVILGIIAAIAIPTINNIIVNSKEDAIRADAKLILNAAKLYQADGHVIGASGVNKVGLADYIESVSTFSDFTVEVDSTTKKLTLTGKGVKSPVEIQFTDSKIEDIDTATATK